MPEYGDKQFWDDRYRSTVDQTFEWYNDYSALQPLFDSIGLKAEDKILNVGCGNSTMGEELYDHGYKNVVNIDYSEPCVELMRKRSDAKRPEMVYEIMDCLNMTFEEGIEFGMIFDKGTLDSLVCGQDVKERVYKYLKSSFELLLPGRSMVIVSYGRPEDRMHYLENDDYSWNITCKVMPKPSLEAAKESIAETFPIETYESGVTSEDNKHFIYVLTKPQDGSK